MEPKNCPLCNNVTQVRETVGTPRSSPWLFVRCPRCRMAGPRFLTRQFAVKNWNLIEVRKESEDELRNLPQAD
jgi:hypothetical protein